MNKCRWIIRKFKDTELVYCSCDADIEQPPLFFQLFLLLRSCRSFVFRHLRRKDPVAHIHEKHALILQSLGGVDRGQNKRAAVILPCISQNTLQMRKPLQKTLKRRFIERKLSQNKKLVIVNIITFQILAIPAWFLDAKNAFRGAFIRHFLQICCEAAAFSENHTVNAFDVSRSFQDRDISFPAYPAHFFRLVLT